MAKATTAIGEAEDLLRGRPIGAVGGPGRTGPVPLPHLDARELALITFARFVSLLVFQRTGDAGKEGPSIAFRVPPDRVHVYQPDNVEDAPFPGIGILPGRVRHEGRGLGPPVELEETMDLFAPDTMLVWQSDHVETLGIEVVADKQPARVAIVAGLKKALQSDDGSGALRLVCRNYFDRVAAFRLDESEQLDDADAARNRRRAHLFVLLQVPEVQLVRYRRMVPIPRTAVVDEL